MVGLSFTQFVSVFSVSALGSTKKIKDQGGRGNASMIWIDGD
jgi:hypothetical protein